MKENTAQVRGPFAGVWGITLDPLGARQFIGILEITDTGIGRVHIKHHRKDGSVVEFDGSTLLAAISFTLPAVGGEPPRHLIGIPSPFPILTGHTREIGGGYNNVSNLSTMQFDGAG